MSIAKPEHCPNCNHAMNQIMDYFCWHHVKRCTACIGDNERKELARIRATARKETKQ